MIRRTIRTITPQVVIDLYDARQETESAAARITDDEKRFIRDCCPSGSVALDIGARLGGFTLLLRDAADEVHAFEPLPFMARRLRYAFMRDEKVRVHTVALSDRTGETTLRLPTHDGSARPDQRARRFRVKLRRLDEWRFAKRVGFVRIDVGGDELAVLEGAAQTLQAHRPVILIDIDACNMPGVVALLRQFGYRGSFEFDGEYLPVEAFDRRRHQPAATPDTLRQFAGAPPPVSNFLFTADA